MFIRSLHILASAPLVAVTAWACAVPAHAESLPATAAAAATPTAFALRAAPPSPVEIIKIILGLVAIVVLAYLGGHPRIQELERRWRVSQVVTAGFPFVLLGLFMRHPAVNILSDSLLVELRPLFTLGLGLIGFAAGFRFDAQGLEALPRNVASLAVMTTILPFATIAAACGVMLVLNNGSDTGIGFLRDAAILGAAGITTARSTPRLVASISHNMEAAGRVTRVVQLEELAAVFCLVNIAAFFRPGAAFTGWQLPAVAWIFVTLGMSTTIGIVIYALLTTYKRGSEITLVTLGSICLSAGMASYLRLSPIVVCFFAGALIVNLPGPWKAQVRDALARLERPVYLLFLAIAGALWRVGDWQGWVLMVLFVAARFAGKYLGVRIGGRKGPELDAAERSALSLAPIGALAVAIVVNAQELYADATVAWFVTAVIGGAVITEIVVQATMRAVPRKAGG